MFLKVFIYTNYALLVLTTLLCFIVSSFYFEKLHTILVIVFITLLFMIYTTIITIFQTCLLFSKRYIFNHLQVMFIVSILVGCLGLVYYVIQMTTATILPFEYYFIIASFVYVIIPLITFFVVYYKTKQFHFWYGIDNSSFFLFV